MGISSAGIGSGLDINGIVTAIMNAERTPLTALQAKEKTFNAKLSAFGTIKSAMDTFKTAIGTLSLDSLNTQSATSSVPDAVGVSASGTAKPGNYSITVQQLARADKQIFPGVASASAQMGAGTMSITVGTGQKISIDTSDNSLQGISQAINKANAGVTATIVNDGTTNRLVVTAQKSGSANSVLIEADGALAAFNTSNPDVMRKTPLDALLTIDDIPVVKSSNTVTDAIAGVTLTLTKESATPITVTMKRDDTAVKANIASFVKALNAVNSAVRTATAYDVASKTGGALNSDSGANSILAGIRKELATPVAGLTGTTTTLASIGIAFQRDGTLSVDDAKLTKAMNANPTVLVDIFTGTGGVGTRLGKLASDILSEKGVIATRTYGINTTLKSLSKQEDALNDRLAIKENNIRRQFSALDSTLAGMQSQSAFVSQQLAAMYKSG